MSTNIAGNQETEEFIPTSIKASDPADLLAYIHHTLGFAPRNSCVGVSLRGKTLGAVLRYDFPPEVLGQLTGSEPDRYRNPVETDMLAATRLLGNMTAQHLRSDRMADGVLLLYILDDRYLCADSFKPLLEGVDVIFRRSLDDVGMPVRQSLLLGDQSVWHLNCEEMQCNIQGAELRDPATSLIGDSLTMLGSKILDGAGTRPLELPTLEAQAANLVALEGQQPQNDDAEALWRWLTEWNLLLDGTGPVHGGGAQAAFLIAGLEHRAWRDTLIISCCYGLEVAIAGMLSLGCLPDEVSQLALVTSDEQAASICLETLVGATGKAPDWTRISLLSSHCEKLIPQAWGEPAAALGVMVVWSYWAKGCGSTASDLIGPLAQFEPGYGMTSLLRQAISAGLICQWALDQETAWSALGRA